MFILRYFSFGVILISPLLKYLFAIHSLIKYMLSLDTPIHQGRIVNTTQEPGTNAASTTSLLAAVG
jgi:hypothetical protein